MESQKTDENSHTLTLPVNSGSGGKPRKARAFFAGDRYQVKRLLGRGGQKEAYLARDTRLDRDVVIAMLRTDQLDPDSADRLRREAVAMGRLGDHPHIVTIHDIGEEEGQPYIVSQYIEGGSLSDLLKASESGRATIEKTLRIGEQVCLGLDHAHSRGFIHRDIKPANVYLASDGRALLGDFGLAVGLDFSRITVEGAVVGTVAYLAPEVALGGRAEPRSDLYSLGAMLYEMVTGRPPFIGDQIVGIISQHINTTPVAPSWHNPEIPRALESLIVRLLSKSPEDRPQSPKEVADAMAAIATSTSVSVLGPVKQDETSLARLAGDVFVGREPEMALLRAGLDEAISGRGGLFLLVGEPGSGKTRTAEQLATYARLRNARVLIGRSYEGEGAPAFWPWVQILRSYVQESDSETLAAEMGPGAAAIAQIVPEVNLRLPDLPTPPRLEPEQARFRMFDSVCNFLRNAGRVRAILLILDDLHWADKPSLLLLQFLARELRESRLMVVGNYRDVEVGRQHPLTQTLGELSRHGISERILLRGLSVHDLARFIEITVGFDPPDALVAAVYKETEGNPFFINETVRLLAAEGRLGKFETEGRLTIKIPEGVREVVGRRLNHLSKECNEALSAASVVGREFDVEAVEAVTGVAVDRLMEVLDEAVAAQVIGEVPGVFGRYTFLHALIRETLYDELSTNRKVRLHRQIGEALENLYRSSIASHLAELAYHFIQGAPGGDVDKAIDYATRAAQRAISLLAYEEAAGQYERALDALELRKPVDEQRLCGMLLDLGQAYKMAGNRAKARESFGRAADLGGKLELRDQFALAALGFGAGITSAVGTVDEEQIKLLRQALAKLGDHDSSLRARLLGQLSMAMYYSPADRMSLSEQAVSMARRVGDPVALVSALYSMHVALVGAKDVKARLAVATEILQIAEAAGDREMALRARYRMILDSLELGDIPAVDQQIEVYSCSAAELRQPFYMWLIPFFRASRAMLEGRFEDCERLAQEALSIGQRVQDPTSLLFFGVLMTTMRVEQGRAEEQEAFVKATLDRYPLIPGNRATLAYVHSHLGRAEETRREFEAISANNFVDLPEDGSRIVVLAMLSWVCAFLGDAARAERIYDLLLPYEGHNIVAGSAPVGCGSVSRPLGFLTATMSRWEDATRHYEAAMEMNTRMGAMPFLAGTQFEYGRLLWTHGRPEDKAKAMELFDQSLDNAKKIGMKRLIERIQSARSNA